MNDYRTLTDYRDLDKALMSQPCFTDLDAADRNWIQFQSPGNYHSHFGTLASVLMESRDFSATAFPFSVWEIVGSHADGTPAAILRANQSTLESALRYMQPLRILVYNREAELRCNWIEDCKTARRVVNQLKLDEYADSVIDVLDREIAG